jgi:hypothetical protein
MRAATNPAALARVWTEAAPHVAAAPGAGAGDVLASRAVLDGPPAVVLVRADAPQAASIIVSNAARRDPAARPRRNTLNPRGG